MNSIGFGTWAWGNKFLWGYSPETDDKVLEEAFYVAINNGIKLIDTADSYGTGKLKGRSEELLGKFLSNLPSKERAKITVATKLAPYPWRIGKEDFRNAFIASQERLQGKLDRVQLHWSTSRYAPWQEINLLDGLAALWEEGLFSELGISNMGPKRLKEIHKNLKARGIPLKSLQTQFSLLSPQPKKHLKIKATCKELNIDLLAYSPLALGVLTIPPRETKLPETFWRKTIFRRLLPSTNHLRIELEKIAIKRNVSQAQVALNWCISNGAIPIPGIRNPYQAKDVSLATKWKLKESEKNKLTSLSEKIIRRMPSNPFQSN